MPHADALQGPLLIRRANPDERCIRHSWWILGPNLSLVILNVALFMNLCWAMNGRRRMPSLFLFEQCLKNTKTTATMKMTTLMMRTIITIMMIIHTSHCWRMQRLRSSKKNHWKIKPEQLLNQIHENLSKSKVQLISNYKKLMGIGKAWRRTKNKNHY